jgi:hypothetical protein
MYTFTISGSYSSILFKNTSGTDNWDKQTNDLQMPTDTKNAFKPYASYSRADGEWYDPNQPTFTPTVTPTTTPTATPGGERIIYYCDAYPSLWDDANAYVWNNENDFACYEAISVRKLVGDASYGNTFNLYKFVIPSRYANVLFKNTKGTSNWDKKTGDIVISTDINKNVFYGGVSGTGKQQEYWTGLESLLAAHPYYVEETPSPTPFVKTTVMFDNSIAKWNRVYAYVWNNTSDANVFSANSIANNMYTFEIVGSYSKILFKNTEGTANWDVQTSDLNMPTDSKIAFKPFASYSLANGEWYDPSFVTQGPTATPTATPYVQRNIATVYYTCSSTAGSGNWSSCYIHFNVNGVWTTVPGYQMTKVEGNKYSYNIDLGNSSQATVCFNNGSGKWDSNGGKNYVVKAGVNNVKDKKVTFGGDVVTTNTTILYNNDSDFTWTNVYAYAWNSTTDYAIFYPTKTYGSKSVIGKDGQPVDVYTYYQFDIPVTYANVLFKNIGNTNEWDAQTQDLVMPNVNNSCFIVDGMDWEGKLYGHWDVVSQETLASCGDMPESEEVVIATGSALVEDIAA